MRVHVTQFARAFLALALTAAAALAQNPDSVPARFAAARDTILAILEAERLPSVAIAVAQRGQIVWAEGFGFADRERRLRATPETMYSLASISKPFTATAMMVLVERGRVDLDRPANDYLGQAQLRAFDGTAEAATVRRVMSHSAGLPLHYQFFYDGVTPPHSHDDAIARYGIIAYPPGEAYFYSNLGYGIVGHIVARLTGRTYEDAMRELVFGPLGLRNTTVSTGRELSGRAAVRYDNNLAPIASYAFDHTGGSGVWSSANDLVRFGMFHLRNVAAGPTQILKRATIERMQRPEAPPTSPGQSYGLGWATLENDFGYRRVSHTGGMPGVSTVLNLYPSEEVAIVVLINKSSGAAPGRIAQAIAAAALPAYQPVRGIVGASSAITPASGVVGNWSGRVLVLADTLPFTLSVEANGSVRARLGTTETSVAGAALNSGGWFTGRFNAPLRAADATPAADRERIVVNFALRRRGDQLTGWASAVTQGPVAYGAVSYRAELRRN